ncbi:D-ribose ABC transporter substrate-binding protein [Nocardioides lentus]|uniref:D-ribose ABC transporter substrate-binding protein n=1 Tax=Nocardioides lentus TaxID=338077 RepID=A0ABP5A8G8_9ACTN
MSRDALRGAARRTATSRVDGARTRRVGAALAITVLVGTTAACGSDAGADTADGEVEGKTVALVACGDVNPWCAVYNKTIVEGLEAEGVTVEYLQDPFDVALQIQNLNSAIASRPDLILNFPTDDQSVVPSLQQAKSQGVPVIIAGSTPAPEAEDLVASTINADQAALGTYAAQNIVEGLQARGLDEGKVIAIAGSDTTATSGERMEAFEEELAKTPEYELVEVRNGNWDPALTGRIASQLFAQYESQGGIQAAYGMADYQANAIIQSAQQAGLPLGVEDDGLIVTGSNCFKVGVDNIRSGAQYGTATQTPTAEGEYVVEHTLAFLRGEEIDEVNLNSEDRVTADNLDEFADVCSEA